MPRFAAPLRSLLLTLLTIAAAGAARADLSAVAPDGFAVLESLDELRAYAKQNGIKARLKPGVYTLDRASSRYFLEFTGSDSHWDLHGVTLRIDTRLFSQFGSRNDTEGAARSFMYCVIALTGDRIVFEGVTAENFGDHPGIQSRNKIFNITGRNVTLRDVEITTSGSSPWGYGSLYGISGGDVRKMNGIRVGWPARNTSLIGCKIHMRAMGHGIFLQGAKDTLIQDCHVDGLLRPTDEILAETSGYAFERHFLARGQDYVEGTSVGPDGKILPREIIALSEDGIRLYDQPSGPTGKTIIVDCTVTRMRRGICTGLGPAADQIINCEVRECVAAGFNLGSNDELRHCRADAKYSEAVALPYLGAHDAIVDLEILDSRGGMANDLLAIINGRQHHVTLRTSKAEFVPEHLVIEVGTHRGYAFYQRLRGEPVSRGHQITNDTPARVLLTRSATENEITSGGAVVDTDAATSRNVVRTR